MRDEPAHALAAHGGDLAKIARRFGIARDTLLDFSANVNPLGPPPALLAELAAAAADPAELARYPEPDAGSFRVALGAWLDVDPDAIVVGNGAAALLDVVARVALPKRCLVPLPAFSEDAHALANAGVTLVPQRLDPSDDFMLPLARLVARLAAGDAGAALVTNPHNPTGALVTRDALGEFLTGARHLAATVIVDEAFVDFVPEYSVVARAPDGDAIVIRSLTKFFAVPALRVGYLVCTPTLAQRLRAALPSWPVGTLATRALGAALADENYATRTRTSVACDRAVLESALQAIGVRTFPSAANFLLVELPEYVGDAAIVTERLIRDARIVVRDCSTYDGLTKGRYVRVAVRARADNDRLVMALRRVVDATARL